jgi:hypothetical protein
LLLFIRVQLLSRDYSDLLLFVELLVELLVLLSNFLDEHETLVFGKDFNKLDCHCVEFGSSVLQSLIEGLNFLHSHACVLGELLERLGVFEHLA